MQNNRVLSLNLPMGAVLTASVALSAVAFSVTVAFLGGSLFAGQHREAAYIVCNEMAQLLPHWSSGNFPDLMRQRQAANSFSEMSYVYRGDGQSRPAVDARLKRPLACPEVERLRDEVGLNRWEFGLIEASGGQMVRARASQQWKDMVDGRRADHQGELEIIFAIDQRLAQTRLQILLTVGLTFFGLLGATLLSWWMNRRVRVGISRVNAAFEAVESGDWSARPQGREDIAEMRVLSAHADAALARIESQMHALRQAGARIAHDLLDPLGLLAARLRRRARADPEIGVFADRIDEIMSTARGLLDMVSAKPKALEPIALAPLIRGVAQDFSVGAEMAGLTLELELAEDVTIMARAEGVRTILDNLFGNAVRHGAPGVLAVSLTTRADSFRLDLSNPATEGADTSGRYGLGAETVQYVALQFGLSPGFRLSGGVAQAWLTGPALAAFY